MRRNELRLVDVPLPCAKASSQHFTRNKNSGLITMAPQLALVRVQSSPDDIHFGVNHARYRLDAQDGFCA